MPTAMTLLTAEAIGEKRPSAVRIAVAISVQPMRFEILCTLRIEYSQL